MSKGFTTVCIVRDGFAYHSPIERSTAKEPRAREGMI
jgi:hypothetical protein